MWEAENEWTSVNDIETQRNKAAGKLHLCGQKWCFRVTESMGLLETCGHQQ